MRITPVRKYINIPRPLAPEPNASYLSYTQLSCFPAYSVPPQSMRYLLTLGAILVIMKTPFDHSTHCACWYISPEVLISYDRPLDSEVPRSLYSADMSGKSSAITLVFRLMYFMCPVIFTCMGSWLCSPRRRQTLRESSGDVFRSCIIDICIILNHILYKLLNVACTLIRQIFTTAILFCIRFVWFPHIFIGADTHTINGGSCEYLRYALRGRQGDVNDDSQLLHGSPGEYGVCAGTVTWVCHVCGDSVMHERQRPLFIDRRTCSDAHLLMYYAVPICGAQRPGVSLLPHIALFHATLDLMLSIVLYVSCELSYVVYLGLEFYDICCSVHGILPVRLLIDLLKSRCDPDGVNLHLGHLRCSRQTEYRYQFRVIFVCNSERMGVFSLRVRSRQSCEIL